MARNNQCAYNLFLPLDQITRKDLSSFSDLQPCKNCINRSTGPTHHADHFILQNHNISCPAWTLLNSFSFRVDNNNQLSNRYKCITSPLITNECQTVSSAVQEFWWHNFLDRQRVSCPDGFGIRNVRLQVPQHWRSKYELDCCRV